jgi:hypothetical protein
MRRLLLVIAVLASLGTPSAVAGNGLIAAAHADDTYNGGQGG